MSLDPTVILCRAASTPLIDVATAVGIHDVDPERTDKVNQGKVEVMREQRVKKEMREMLPVADHSGVDEDVVVATSVEDVEVTHEDHPVTMIKKTMVKVAIKMRMMKEKKGDHSEVEEVADAVHGTTVVTIAHDANTREMIKMRRKEKGMMMRINHSVNVLNGEDIEDVVVAEAVAEVVASDEEAEDVAVEAHEEIMTMRTEMQEATETTVHRNMKVLKRNHHRKFLLQVMERVQCNVVVHNTHAHVNIMEVLPIF